MASDIIARWRFNLRRRPVMLAALTVLAIVFFLAVTGLSQVHQAQRRAIGERWFSRGIADLNAKRFAVAVTDFRAALLYSPDDYSYQLNLAEALIGEGQRGQALAYLINLWEREPENGIVNLELARIAAQQGQTNDAIRYYHNAVYAVWPADRDTMRRDARLELIELLLRIGAKPQAQGELIALEEGVGPDPDQQERVGGLFLRADDYEHALSAFSTVLKSDRHNAAALAGAGYAAFALGRYPEGRHYLQAAIAANPDDTTSQERLKTTQLVLQMDPFRRQIPIAERDRIVVQAFQTAGERLRNCKLPTGTTSAGSVTPSLSDKWERLNPQITEARLRRNPDLVETAMDLVFRIEHEASAACGSPTGADLALLLISNMHEGS
ncbi:MAG TPA: tetratricopeptide repeat protein [Candidatus Sulfotelmatobacter sp.]|nr:tetratricopeptide repeat protein [Candidatus Sulfotelmatobacter sp.]